MFPLEWTESNPNFLLTLLDQFNIEGKEEIIDLFVKVDSKAIFLKFLSLTLRPNFDYQSLILVLIRLLGWYHQRISRKALP